jgi:sulfate/thiosulfate transport system ATP-binding protein
MFTGAFERLRVRLADGAAAPLLSSDEGSASTTLQVTRTRYAQRGFELSAGQQVAIGVRRLHLLPTPLSSFTACAPSAALAESLGRQPLLTELAARMKTRIGARIEPDLGVAQAPCQTLDTFVGATVLAAQPDCARRAEWLLRRGAHELLVLPEAAGAPQRVLIHWTDDAARSATLGVSASVLRHVPAEAVYVGIVPADSDASRPQGMRELLDARSEAQAAHGLEMRTELRFGDATRELTRRLADSPAQMLILGVTELDGFAARWHALLDAGRWPVLIVLRPAS